MFQWYVNEKRLRTFSVYATSIFQLMHASCLSCVYKGSGKTVFKASLSLTQMSLFTFLFPYLCNVLFFFPFCVSHLFKLCKYCSTIFSLRTWISHANVVKSISSISCFVHHKKWFLTICKYFTVHCRNKIHYLCF